MFNKITFEWFYLFYFLLLFGLFLGVRILLFGIRKRAFKIIKDLLYRQENFFLYQEFLKNRRLRLVFRKQAIEIMKLNGYLLAGDDANIVAVITRLDAMKLEPYEKLDYYQKRFSYFTEILNKEEAKKSLENLKSLDKDNNNSVLKEIVQEANLVYEIYICRNTDLIPELEKLEKQTADKIQKGITEFRLAKLYYFDKNYEKTQMYLDKAKENVRGTLWYPIIIEAKKNNRILAVK